MSQRLTTPLPRVSWRISDKRWLCSQANCGSSACHLSSYKPTIYNNTLKALRSSCIRKYVIPISYRVVLGSKADLEFTIFLPQPSKFCFIFLTKKKRWVCVWECVCAYTHVEVRGWFPLLSCGFPWDRTHNLGDQHFYPLSNLIVLYAFSLN